MMMKKITLRKKIQKMILKMKKTLMKILKMMI